MIIYLKLTYIASNEDHITRYWEEEYDKLLEALC